MSQTEYVRQLQNSKNKFKKLAVVYIVHVLSKMWNVANSRCCFVTFCKQRQRNEQRTITHAYTAIVLVAIAVAVEDCLIKLPKTEFKRQIMNSQTSTKQTKARPSKKAAESSGMKRNQNM